MAKPATWPRARRVEYIGPSSKLWGKTAMAINRDYGDEDGVIRVQFDDVELVHLGTRLGAGWHAFPESFFKYFDDVPVALHEHEKGEINPWVPMRRPVDLKHLGKFAEELGECQAAVARCIIQGIDEKEPVTGKPNRQWFEEEIADVLANINLVAKHFALDREKIEARVAKKEVGLARWHAMLA